jgi:Fic family protein
MEAKFKHFDLNIAEPSFASPLTDLIIELDHLRRKKLQGSTHPKVFFQLKHIFHTLESVGSARIEGNNTTIAEYIETQFEKTTPVSPSILEIQNIEQAMAFIEETIEENSINRAYISELHKKIVKGLPLPPDGEGDRTPGEYRKSNVRIAQSSHRPPDYLKIGDYMEELFNFINHEDSHKYDLLKVAIAHHRFVWIHPFTNGNGRSVRLFTYALLVKLGFNVGRILNPTAVFCSNRDNYYQYLSLADSGENEGMLSWCTYVLKGLKEEMEKIDRLLDYVYLRTEILEPAIRYSLARQFITDKEAKILKTTVDKQIIQASDLKVHFPGKQDSEISRQIRKLIEKNMLVPEKEGARKYIISFNNNFLLRGIMKALDERDFLPIKDKIDN